MKMKFTNLIAYCLCMYDTERLHDNYEIWKDMVHCIKADGFICRNKHDVYNKCMRTMEEVVKNFPYTLHAAMFPAVYEKINNIISNSVYNIDMYDAGILAFRDFIVNWHLSSEGFEAQFNGGVIPDDKVLPVSKSIGKLWETIMRICTPQEIDPEEYSKIEEYLKGKH